MKVESGKWKIQKSPPKADSPRAENIKDQKQDKKLKMKTDREGGFLVGRRG